MSFKRTNKVSRRAFLATAVSAGAATAILGMTGCSPAVKNDENANPQKTTEPLASTFNPSREETCDLVIVGAGISGLAAAVQAAEEGIQHIVLLEKGSVAGGNGMGTEGIFAVDSVFQKEQDININPVEILRGELNQAQWRTNGAMWNDLIRNSAENMDWLIGKGVVFSGAVVGIGNAQVGHPFDGAGGQCYVPQMLEAAQKAQVDVRLSMPAQSILTSEDGKVCGVIAGEDDECVQFNAPTVILASGGVGANPEYLREIGWSQEKIDEMMVVCQPTIMGDGYRMAMEVGAKSFLSDAAIQSFQAVRAFGSDSTVPLDSPLNGGNGLVALGPCCWIDQDCNRFCDESLALSYNMAANAMACIQNAENYAIFDSAFVNSLQLDEADQKILNEAIAGSDPQSVYSSESLEDLAKHFDLDVSAFMETINRYNNYCESGLDEELGKDAAFLLKIEQPPFFIAKMINNLIAIDGGITTNIRSEVLNDELKPIPGLYAVGLDGAMLWRKVYTQNMPGTMMGQNINTGRNAARAAARYLSA